MSLLVDILLWYLLLMYVVLSIIIAIILFYSEAEPNSTVANRVSGQILLFIQLSSTYIQVFCTIHITVKLMTFLYQN